MLRELDIMLGMIDQEWAFPQAEEAAPAAPLEELSGVYPIAERRRLEPEGSTGPTTSLWRRARTSLARMLALT